MTEECFTAICNHNSGSNIPTITTHPARPATFSANVLIKNEEIIKFILVVANFRPTLPPMRYATRKVALFSFCGFSSQIFQPLFQSFPGSFVVCRMEFTPFFRKSFSFFWFFQYYFSHKSQKKDRCLYHNSTEREDFQGLVPAGTKRMFRFDIGVHTRTYT